MDNLIGKKLDGLYEVKELIGSGGMANVRLGSCAILDCLVNGRIAGQSAAKAL